MRGRLARTQTNGRALLRRLAPEATAAERALAIFGAAGGAAEIGRPQISTLDVGGDARHDTVAEHRLLAQLRRDVNQESASIFGRQRLGEANQRRHRFIT